MTLSFWIALFNPFYRDRSFFGGWLRACATLFGGQPRAGAPGPQESLALAGNKNAGPAVISRTGECFDGAGEGWLFLVGFGLAALFA